MEGLINIMQYLYKNGDTLKTIYDKVTGGYGQTNGPFIFSEFCVMNKKDSKFMEEFNKTAFI